MYLMDLISWDLVVRSVGQSAGRILPGRRRTARQVLLDLISEQESSEDIISAAKTNPVIKHKQSDLVICPHYSFENRWKTDLVDYEIVERWAPIRLEMDNSGLKRLKVYRLGRLPKLSLLRNLESYDRLTFLELDRLELALDQKITTFSLKNLQVLSIGSIVAVDADEKKVSRGRVIAEFNSDVLKRVHLGPNCIEHLKFSNPASIRSLYFGPEPAISYGCIGLDNLEYMQWNQLEEFHSFMILEYALGMRGKLKHLHCNLDRLESPTQLADKKRLRILKNLYNLLKREEVDSDKLTICFNGVRLNLKVFEFQDYKFDWTPIEFHHHNVAVNGLYLISCRSVSHVDYLQLLDKQFDPQPADSVVAEGLRINLRAFAKTYPCVRVVNLDNIADLVERVEPEPFIRFLSYCRALTRLQMNCSKFASTVYDQLAKLDSVKTLDYLSLFEANRFPEPINHRFICELLYLRHLQTNLASKAVMLYLIARMEIDSEFLFGFWAPTGGADFYRCLIKKLDRTDRDRWRVYIEKCNFDDQTFRQNLYSGTLSLGQLEDYFNYAENAPITAHWLDKADSFSSFLSTIDEFD